MRGWYSANLDKIKFHLTGLCFFCSLLQLQKFRKWYVPHCPNLFCKVWFSQTLHIHTLPCTMLLLVSWKNWPCWWTSDTKLCFHIKPGLFTCLEFPDIFELDIDCTLWLLLSPSFTFLWKTISFSRVTSLSEYKLYHNPARSLNSILPCFSKAMRHSN